MRTRSQIAADEHAGNQALAFTFVTEFMDPKDLFRFALTSKSTARCISLRSVVKTAMLNGNENQRRSIEILYTLTSVGSIHLPSVMRTLRLLNARRCEFCNVNAVKHVRESYGVAACWSCTKECTSVISTRYPNERRHCIETDDVIRNSRVASRFCAKMYATPFNEADSYFVWKSRIVLQSVFSEGGTERAGPIVILEDIRRFEEFRRPDEIERYMTSTLRAAPMGAYYEFNNAVRANRVISYAVAQLRKEKKLRACVQARRKKIRQVKAIIAKLTPLLNGNVRLLFEHQSLELADYATRRDISVRSYACIHFFHAEVDNVMREYVLSPSKMNSKKKLHQLADTLNSIDVFIDW